MSGDIVAVLAAHDYDGGWRCGCGWTGSYEEHLTHLAGALAPPVAAAKAEAWDEGWLARDDWEPDPRARAASVNPHRETV